VKLLLLMGQRDLQFWHEGSLRCLQETVTISHTEPDEPSQQPQTIP
jgi:hypothetical protein